MTDKKKTVSEATDKELLKTAAKILMGRWLLKAHPV